MQSKRSNSLRSATLIERCPDATGVVVGPLRAMPRSRIESRVRSGSGLPSSSKTSTPAGCSSQSNSTPVASSTRRVASMSSGPVPSPGIRLTAWAMGAAMLASAEKRAQFARHALGLAVQAAPGEANHSVASEEKRRVPSPVALERGAGLALELPAVELGHPALLRPQRVDDELAERDVDRGQGDAVAAAERQEDCLERRPGVDQRRPPVLEQRPEHPEAAPAVTARADRLDRGQVEKPEPLGLVEAPLDLARPDDLRQVEQGPGDGRYRDALVDGAVVGVQGAHAVDVDAGAGACGRAGNGDVRPRARSGPQTPERSSVPM